MFRDNAIYVLESAISYLLKGKEFNSKSHIRRECEWILLHILNMNLFEFYSKCKKIFLSKKQKNLFFSMIKRRSMDEPLQYILSNSIFLNLKFYVDKRVFIPRPETEEFVDLIIKYIKDYFKTGSCNNGHLSILDLGSGSGVIALSILRTFPNLKIYAIDNSISSLTVLKKNFKRLGKNRNLVIKKSNWFEEINSDQKFDLIISNPPYISKKEFKFLSNKIKLFEPKNALVSKGKFGTKDLKTIIQNSKKYLKKNGKIFLEYGGSSIQTKILKKIALKNSYTFFKEFKDFKGNKRFIVLKE
jgi:release factor glutamine methyltransferase